MLYLSLCCLGWLSLWLVVMSGIEYGIHRWLMHNHYWSRFSEESRKAFQSHAVLHHGKYFRRDFTDCDDPASEFVSIDLSPGYMLLGLSPLWLTVGLAASVLGAAVLVAVILAHGLVWTAIHREMHKPSEAWFAKSSVYGFWHAYHKQHHEKPSTNFNVVIPLWDFIFRTYGGLSK